MKLMTITSTDCNVVQLYDLRTRWRLTRWQWFKVFLWNLCPVTIQLGPTKKILYVGVSKRIKNLEKA